MTLVSTVEVAEFLGVPADEPGLLQAIGNAEALLASRLNLPTLQEAEYNEQIRVEFDQQVLIPGAGPIFSVTSCLLDGEDVTDDVLIHGSAWGITLESAHGSAWVFNSRGPAFRRGSDVTLVYRAGWGNDNPLPPSLKEWLKAYTGMTLANLLASGVYDTKLGDLTVKIQREQWESNLRPYEDMAGYFARPVI